MFKFKKISELQKNFPGFEKENFFLTFDIDWAHDDVIYDTINMVDSYSVKATWFVTHSGKYLYKLRSNNAHELGIHPNFNRLFVGGSSGKDSAYGILNTICHIVPEAKSVRAHSLTYSGYLLSLYRKFKIENECSYFYCGPNVNNVMSWLHPSGILHVPHIWEDDIAISDDKYNRINSCFNSTGLKVFNFHPIHVFLNSNNMKIYENTRDFHKDPDKLIKYRYSGYGVRNMLEDLLKLSI